MEGFKRGVHLQMRLVLGLEDLLVVLFDYLFLVVEIGLGIDLGLGLYMSQMLDLHSQYIHSFNIIGGQWLLLLGRGYGFHLLCIEFVRMVMQ